MGFFDHISDGDMATLERIRQRAEQFDGYGGETTEAAEKLALEVRCRWFESGFQGWGPDDLRAALFTEFRMLHMGGYPPTERHYTYLLALDAASNGNDGVFSPWTGLTKIDGKWFIPEDLPHIEAFNAAEREKKHPNEKVMIDLTLVPEPYAGRLDAPIVLLSLNPGAAADDPEWHGKSSLQELVLANLRQEPSEWPLHYLHPDLKDSPGGRWYRKLLKPLIAAAGGGETGTQLVSQRVLNVEFHGYHSISYLPLPVTLPTQRWMFSRLLYHLDERAVVIGLRGKVSWVTALPELARVAKWAHSAQTSLVSPNNVGEKTFADAIAALR